MTDENGFVEAQRIELVLPSYKEVARAFMLHMICGQNNLYKNAIEALDNPNLTFTDVFSCEYRDGDGNSYKAGMETRTFLYLMQALLPEIYEHQEVLYLNDVGKTHSAD